MFSAARLYDFVPTTCRNNLPSGLHSARTCPRSLAVKSGPAVAAFVPLRLIWMMPTTFPSSKIGALIIFWIASWVPRRPLSRLQKRGMPHGGKIIDDLRAAFPRGPRRQRGIARQRNIPDVRNASGAKKCKCFQRVDKPRIATSFRSSRPGLGDAFGHRLQRDLGLSSAAVPKALGERSNSVTKLKLCVHEFSCANTHGRSCRRCPSIAPYSNCTSGVPWSETQKIFRTFAFNTLPTPLIRHKVLVHLSHKNLRQLATLA